MDFIFEDIAYKDLFLLVCNSIKNGDYYMCINKLHDLSHIKLLIHVGDLDFNVNISNVYKNNNGNLSIDSDKTYSKIYINVSKIDLIFGNRLVRNTYYYRSSVRTISCAYDLTVFLIKLIESNIGLKDIPKRIFNRDKSNMKECIDIDIRKHARVLKIDNLI